MSGVVLALASEVPRPVTVKGGGHMRSDLPGFGGSLQHSPKYHRSVRQVPYLPFVDPVANVYAYRGHIHTFRRLQVYILVADSFRPMLHEVREK